MASVPSVRRSSVTDAQWLMPATTGGIAMRSGSTPAWAASHSVLLTVSSLRSLSISLPASACITPRRPSSMSISVTCAPPRTGDCISRRIRIGTKLLLPPPMIVTFAGIGGVLLVHRVVAHGQDRRLEDAVRARPRHAVDDGVGDLLGPHHQGQVGVAGRAASAHGELGVDAAGGDRRAAHALAMELVVERPHESDLGELGGGGHGLTLLPALAGHGGDDDQVGSVASQRRR